jgi:hypothetical protein
MNDKTDVCITIVEFLLAILLVLSGWALGAFIWWMSGPNGLWYKVTR